MTRWIFVRGLARDQRHWGDFIAQFERINPDSSIICIDLPGNGARNGETSLVTVDAMVADLRHSIARLAIDGPFNLLAMSLGAMVAVEWARCYPAEISRCLLINTSLRRFNAFHERLRPINYPLLPKILLAGSDVAYESAILRLTSNHRGEETIRQWSALRHEHPVRPGNILRQLLAAARYAGPAKPPDCHLLLLASRGDRLVDVSCSRQISQHWSVPLVEHPDAGHDLPLDDGPWVAEQVHRWLEAL